MQPSGGKRWQGKRNTGRKTQGKSEAITSFSSPGSTASAGGTAGSAANRVVCWFRVRERRQNRFGHNGKERGRLTQAGKGKMVAVTATKSAQSEFPRPSRQAARFRTAQPDFMLERPQRIILDATNPDPWDLRNALH